MVRTCAEENRAEHQRCQQTRPPCPGSTPRNFDSADQIADNAADEQRCARKLLIGSFSFAEFGRAAAAPCSDLSRVVRQQLRRGNVAVDVRLRQRLRILCRTCSRLSCAQPHAPAAFAPACCPALRPNTITSSRLLPIRRLRPWMPPAASPATNRFCHAGHAVYADLQSAVLIVQRGIDEDRRLRACRCHTSDTCAAWRAGAFPACPCRGSGRSSACPARPRGSPLGVGTPLPRVVHSRMIGRRVHVAGLQRMDMKASPSLLTSFAPMERTFSVTSAP